MMARLEMGEVLQTTSIGNILQYLRQPVVPRDFTLGQLTGKGVLGEACHAGSLAKSEPASGIVAGREFNLHMALTFPGTQGKLCKDGLNAFQGAAHDKLSYLRPLGSARPWNRC